jgi:hypothetical protein
MGRPPPGASLGSGPCSSGSSRSRGEASARSSSRARVARASSSSRACRRGPYHGALLHLLYSQTIFQLDQLALELDGSIKIIHSVRVES